MSKEHSVFYRAWNSNRGKKIVSAIYSAGASVVILGALFKILHLPMANIMLMVGMTTEAIIFALGIFDTPHKEFDWGKVFDFKKEDDAVKLNENPMTIATQGGKGGGLHYTDSLGDGDMLKLKDSIKNLTNTADNLQSLTSVATSAGNLSKSIDNATQATESYHNIQKKLFTSAEDMANSFNGIHSEMENVANNTKSYNKKIDDVNKSLSSINSIYEIQLKHIQSQTEGLNQQAESLRNVSSSLDDMAGDIDKMRQATAQSFTESEKYRAASSKLSKHIEDLNAVYGNMLNALS